MPTVLILKFLKEEEDSGGRQIAFLVGILEDLTWPFMVLGFEVVLSDYYVYIKDSLIGGSNAIQN